jgi:hypothetical protein
VERAFLKNENTTIILVKQVVSISMAGASESIVRRNRICRAVPSLAGSVVSSTPMVILGIGTWANELLARRHIPVISKV